MRAPEGSLMSPDPDGPGSLLDVQGKSQTRTWTGKRRNSLYLPPWPPQIRALSPMLVMVWKARARGKTDGSVTFSCSTSAQVCA